MTKNRESGDKARVRFRYVEFDVEGGNASIQEGLRNIASALARGAPMPKALPVAPDGAARKNGEATLPDQPPLVPGPDGPDADAGQLDVTPQTGEGDAKPRRSRRYPAPNVINGLDLDGDPSLAEFAVKKAPDGHNARYLVAAAWFRQHKGMKEFTADHVFTVYQRLGWPTAPVDIGMPLRALKKQHLLDSGEKPGTYAANDAGLAKVDRMSSAA